MSKNLGKMSAGVDTFLTRLKPIRKRYTSSFTMHALDHIINGTRVERVFWTLKLSMVIGTACFMSRQLFFSYFLNHVDTLLVFQPQVNLYATNLFVFFFLFLFFLLFLVHLFSGFRKVEKINHY